MISGVFGKRQAMRLSGLLTILIIISFLALTAAAYAAEITYTGDGKDLQDAPVWFPTQPASSLFPGTAAAPSAHGNKITIDYDPDAPGVTNPDFVFGGLSKLGMASNNNSVVMSNGATGDIYGGWSYDGGAANNTVVVGGGSVGDDVYGGWSKAGVVRENSVAVSKSRVGRTAFGGHSIEGDVINNTLNARDISASSIGGGWSYDGNATGNTVRVAGDSAISDIFGGMSGDGSATGNKVTLSFGIVHDSVYGGWSGNGDGDAADNSVAVTGGVVGRAIHGGLNINGNATDNTVTVSGMIKCDLVYGGAAISGNATGNTVTINGRPRGLTKAKIYGGYVDDEGDSFTGNTLKLNSSGISVKTVGNFEYYSFDFPENLAEGAVILSVTEQADLKGTTVKVSLQGSTELRKGDKIALIRSEKGVANSPKNKSCQVKQGGVLYEFSIYTDSNNLWAEVTKINNAAK